VAAEEEVGEDVGAALGHGARVVGAADGAGQELDGRERGLGLVSGHQSPELGHAFVEEGDADVAFREPLLAARLGAFGVEVLGDSSSG